MPRRLPMLSCVIPIHLFWFSMDMAVTVWKLSVHFSILNNLTKYVWTLVLTFGYFLFFESVFQFACSQVVTGRVCPDGATAGLLSLAWEMDSDVWDGKYAPILIRSNGLYSNLFHRRCQFCENILRPRIQCQYRPKKILFSRIFDKREYQIIIKTVWVWFYNFL